jgi:osmoprotectant transport system ATP-binding protein
LSGGQRQRVGVARALAARPPVVLMDEPFGALDPYTRRHVRRELFGLSELQEKTVVLVTHDVAEAVELGNRIALMDKGKIVQIGTADELQKNPATDFVQDFMG